MATLTLRPNAAGDETNLSPWVGQNWENVDEEEPDELTTRVRTASDTYLRDLYNLPNHTAGSGTINSIKIYFRIQASVATGTCYAKPTQKSGATVTDGAEVSTSLTTFTTYSQTYTTNPATGSGYTWNEIDDLQIGVSLCDNGTAVYAQCTQVYVEVDYTAGWANIAKVSGVAAASIAKVNGVAVADIAKVNGVAV